MFRQVPFLSGFDLQLFRSSLCISSWSVERDMRRSRDRTVVFLRFVRMIHFVRLLVQLTVKIVSEPTQSELI